MTKVMIEKQGFTDSVRVSREEFEREYGLKQPKRKIPPSLLARIRECGSAADHVEIYQQQYTNAWVILTHPYRGAVQDTPPDREKMRLFKRYPKPLYNSEAYSYVSVLRW